MGVDDLVRVAELRRRLKTGDARRIREACDVHQAEMAAALGVSQPSLSLYERGVTSPRTAVALRYAALLTTLDRVAGVASCFVQRSRDGRERPCEDDDLTSDDLTAMMDEAEPVDVTGPYEDDMRQAQVAASRCCNVKPGNYNDTRAVPVCELPPGHDGVHEATPLGIFADVPILRQFWA